MIIRNIFRNKGRSFLSLVGILCCNMLIICSFGLQESINTFIDDYYTHTLRYDVRANLISGQASSLDHYRETLNAMKVDGIMEQSVSLRSETNLRSCLLTVMTDDQTSIALGDNATFLTLPRTGTAISRKLAGLMNVGLGDTVSICLPGDSDTISLTINALADTNIGQGLFMSKEAWEACRKSDFK